MELRQKLCRQKVHKTNFPTTNVKHGINSGLPNCVRFWTYTKTHAYGLPLTAIHQSVIQLLPPHSHGVLNVREKHFFGLWFGIAYKSWIIIEPWRPISICITRYGYESWYYISMLVVCLFVVSLLFPFYLMTVLNTDSNSIRFIHAKNGACTKDEFGVLCVTHAFRSLFLV